MTVFFFQEDTWYLLNLFSQSLGFYLQWLPSLSFQGDAFPQSPAQAPDGTGADPGFMNAWTIFYWGWWIAWSPFVGMFVAKISRGRTIREFVNGVLSAPVLYSFLWYASLPLGASTRGLALNRACDQTKCVPAAQMR